MCQGQVSVEDTVMEQRDDKDCNVYSSRGAVVVSMADVDSAIRTGRCVVLSLGQLNPLHSAFPAFLYSTPFHLSSTHRPPSQRLPHRPSIFTPTSTSPMTRPPTTIHDPHSLFSQLVTDCPPVNLENPISPTPSPPLDTPTQPTKPPPQEEDPDDEYQTDPETLRTPSLPAKRPLPTPNSPEQRRRHHHNTHTRRCRARLNCRFDELNRILPAPENTEVKHKVHILDHAITALNTLRAENDHLHLLVALRSTAAVAKWATAFASTAPTAVDALAPVLDMLTFMGGWPLAEVWAVNQQLRPLVMRVERFLVKSSPMLQPGLMALGRYGGSVGGIVVDMDFVGRPFLDGMAQWSPNCVDQCRHGGRAHVMAAARVRTCFVVPVPVDGETSHVVALYDVRERLEDPELVEFATFVAATVGNCFGAAQRKRACEVALLNTPRITPKTAKLRD